MSTRRRVPDQPDKAVQVETAVDAAVHAGPAVAGPAVADTVILAAAPVAAAPVATVTAEAPAEVEVEVEPVEVEPAELKPEAADLVRRLKRVQGQVGGLIRMVEADRTSAEIITQLSAAEHALHRVGFLLVAEEMRNCARGGGDDPEVTARIKAAEKLFLRLG